jgi:hypothetical protein
LAHEKSFNGLLKSDGLMSSFHSVTSASNDDISPIVQGRGANMPSHQMNPSFIRCGLLAVFRSNVGGPLSRHLGLFENSFLRKHVHKDWPKAFSNGQSALVQRFLRRHSDSDARHTRTSFLTLGQNW